LIPSFPGSNPGLPATKYRMRLFEIARMNFDPLLIDFWRQSTPKALDHYFVQDNCIDASQDFEQYLVGRGIGFGEIVPIGRMVNGKKKAGWFRADRPNLGIDALDSGDMVAMKQQGLDYRKQSDRMTYITNNDLEDEFKWIPHSWVELRGKILDPSGFYIDGRSGQFDRMVNDKSNPADRYQYFS